MSTDTKQAKVSEDLGQGNKPQQEGNMAKSVESYQKALELNPNSVPALSELAKIYREQKQYDGAFTYYLKLVSLRPKKPSFFQSLVRVSIDYGKLLLKKNDLNRAIAAYQEFLNQKLPKNGNLDKIDRICQTLGESIHQLSIRQGEFSPATTFFQEAIEKFPYKVWSYYHLGNILAQQDKLDEAIACCEKAVEIRPKFSLGLLLLGTLVLKKGYLDQAFQCGLKILEYQGRFKNIELNYNLIKLLSIQSDNKQSQEALQKTIEQIEASSVKKPKLKLAVYRNIAKILRNQNKLDEAMDFYQKSLCFLLQKSKPEFVENHWEEGKLQAPDFSVIGLAKCGTTAFYDYLCQHPQVLPAVEKEPMYLYHWLVKSKDFETRDWSLPSAEKDFYLAHFAPRPEGGHFITGEASTTNVLPGCDKIMSSWFPNIKLIVILREPVRRTISHYEELLKLGNQKGTLEEIINSQLDQLEASTNIGKTAIKKLMRRGWKEHIAMSLYVYPLERWMNLFPREQFLILTNEELAQYPEETMNQAFDFLGLPECNSIEYHPRNVGSYPQLDSKLLSRLSNFFRPHNQRLEELLGRKFNWDDN
ncbi:MAG: tetratricopeptide repeat protein [Xenococcaceae cyanobacterium MO_207.B15]|nr:tetratricopeptide repeat protein [Xenococcaceae cyanobacterium MO_207.B15]